MRRLSDSLITTDDWQRSRSPIYAPGCHRCTMQTLQSRRQIGISALHLMRTLERANWTAELASFKLRRSGNLPDNTCTPIVTCTT